MKARLVPRMQAASVQPDPPMPLGRAQAAAARSQGPATAPVMPGRRVRGESWSLARAWAGLGVPGPAAGGALTLADVVGMASGNARAPGPVAPGRRCHRMVTAARR